ncbi:hypothetical protein AA0114_g4417 [Alternaria tenuissima]|uniref:Uncharacterized protein n=1 Tax=Alternaria tenuissima TaxID=119927 RepID=A0A4Q4MMS3_9PLEO|nr:hypothetical protein AA0114_g4417 [Alternaria tenuissima]
MVLEPFWRTRFARSGAGSEDGRSQTWANRPTNGDLNTNHSENTPMFNSPASA